jgi:hypothetical protein
MNEFVDALNPLLAMEGTDGLKVTKSDGRFLIGYGGPTGSFSGSFGTGSAVAFRGRWNASTNYAAGDVVFLDGTAEQAELNAHTYVCKLQNIDQHPPPTTTAYEDAYWRTVAIGSFPTFVVADPFVAPSDERKVTVVPGALQCYISGSAGTGVGTDDYTNIVGGVVEIEGRLLVNGRAVVQFEDGTKVIIDAWDMDQPSNRLYGKEFKLRELRVCVDGVIKGMGVLCTEPYSLT